MAEIEAIADTLGKSGWRDLMMSIWRKHLIICLFLGLLAIPMYLMTILGSPGMKRPRWRETGRA